MIEIKLNGDQDLNGYTLIELFPSMGLVGAMAGSYMIEKLNMECIGYLKSDLFPPIAAVHDSKPMLPARVYKSSSLKLVLFMAEFIIPPQLITPLAAELLSFSRKYKISRMVSVGGLPSKSPGDSIYAVSSTDIGQQMQKAGIMPIGEGMIGGVSALLLNNAAEYGIPVLDILVEVNPLIMDPKYAELAITGLNRILSINIDLAELHKEVKLVEAKIHETMKKVKEHQDHMESGEPPVPSDQSMYA